MGLSVGDGSCGCSTYARRIDTARQRACGEVQIYFAHLEHVRAGGDNAYMRDQPLSRLASYAHPYRANIRDGNDGPHTS